MPVSEHAAPAGADLHANTQQTGRAVANLLRHSWRRDPGPADMDASEILPLLPLLDRAGCNALAWKRLPGELRDDPRFAGLRDQARLNALGSAVQTKFSMQLTDLLEQNGIPNFLIKGIAVASCYAAAGDRPSGDIDIVVSPGDLRRASSLLAGRGKAWKFSPPRAVDTIFTLQPRLPGSMEVVADLHGGLAKFGIDDATMFDAVIHGKNDLPVLRNEEHYRVVVVHFLSHGGWRPLWLCDVAAIMESAEPDFFSTGLSQLGYKTRSWLVAVAALAERLLGAQIPGSLAGPAQELDIEWLEQEVLGMWGGDADLSRMRTRLRNLLADPASIDRQKIESSLRLPLAVRVAWNEGPFPSARPGLWRKLRYSLRRLVDAGKK